MLVHQPEGPIMASHGFSVELFDPDDLAALVASAVRAHLMGRLRLEARGAKALARDLKGMVGATLVAARSRYLVFRISHRKSPVRESTLAGATGEVRKGSPSRINLGLASAVINFVQICSATRAQAGTARLTQDPHRHREKDLLGCEFGQVELLTLQERNVEIAFIETRFSVERRRFGQVVFEREFLCDAPGHRFQAPRTGQRTLSGATAGDRKNLFVRAHLTLEANRNFSGHLIGTEPVRVNKKLLVEAKRLVLEL
jgi:hypothetical protein